MNYEVELKKMDNDYKKLKEISKQRGEISNNLVIKLHDWLYDTPFTNYLRLNKDTSPTIFGYNESELFLEGFSQRIWMRRVLDENRILFLIGSAELEYISGEWYYEEKDNKTKLTKDLYFKILVQEIQNYFPDYC